VHLTRRNLLSLLAKLDRHAEGEATFCTIVKCDTQHPKYPIKDANAVVITAVEDEDYYTDRAPGVMAEDS
jgi:hypothetical protein